MQDLTGTNHGHRFIVIMKPLATGVAGIGGVVPPRWLPPMVGYRGEEFVLAALLKNRQVRTSDNLKKGQKALSLKCLLIQSNSPIETDLRKAGASISQETILTKWKNLLSLNSEFCSIFHNKTRTVFLYKFPDPKFPFSHFLSFSIFEKETVETERFPNNSPQVECARNL